MHTTCLTRATYVLCSLLLSIATGLLAQSQCPSTGVAVQVLGSGGPRAGTERASSSYLVWVEGRARVMVDVGGGAFVRFGEAGARLADLRLLAISHLHPDHVTDLPGLLWLSNLDRKEPLRLVGPSGNEHVLSLTSFLTQLFDPDLGAFPGLSGPLGGPGPGVLLDPLVVVDVEEKEPHLVLQEPGLEVYALPVPHRRMPALAYRVEVQGRSIVFSGDQNGQEAGFVDFSKDATALVMHMAASPSSTSPASLDRHAPPAIVGQVAEDASVQQLILSHLYRHNSPDDLEAGIAEVRSRYGGVLHVSADLACYPLP